MPRTPRVTDKLRGKTMIYLGAGLALAGAGIATATAGFGNTPATVGAKYAAAHATAGPTTAHRGDPARHADGHAVGHSGHRAGPAGKSSHPVRAAASTHHGPAHHAPAHHAPAHHAPAHHATHHAARQVTHQAVHHSGHAKNQGWGAVSRILAARTIPRAGHGPLPAADRLTPDGTSGPQAWMPITTARWDNARTIVRQTYDRRMGLRSAVIAVATAMQESSLLNIAYGDRDSLGLFQQRPSAGWGSPAQILRPTYAAGAFLSALRGYQARNPAWANQPLWAAAQGVQNSGFPYAYAKWEAQAAALVASITKHLI
jgi:hypothetical protein